MKVAQVLYQELDIGAVALPIERNCWPLPELVTITIYRQTDFFDLHLKSD